MHHPEDVADGLALDVAVHAAVGAEASNLLRLAKKHSLTLAQLRERVRTPEFRRELDIARSSKGYARAAHQMRCASVAEPMLERMIELIKDPDTADSVKVRIYELIRADGGLSIKDEAPVGNAVQINIYKVREPGGEPVVTTRIGAQEALPGP